MKRLLTLALVLSGCIGFVVGVWMLAGVGEALLAYGLLSIAGAAVWRIWDFEFSQDD